LTSTDVNAVLHNPLGDIVHSQMAYVGQPWRLSLDPTFTQFVAAVNGSNKYRNAVVYVGANDGMLHGFDAGQGTSTNFGTGQEVMAYVPRGLMAHLHADTFATPSYTHQYWVDGSPMSGDVQLGVPGAGTTSANNPGNWATALAGTLGAGGPGYFVLDVTSPGMFSPANAANASKLVLIDATDTSSTSPLDSAVLPYIGYQFGPPVMDQYNTTSESAQIVQINTNKLNAQGRPVEWAVIMGNGYNSASGLPVLLIQSLTQEGGNGHLALYPVPATCTAADISGCIAAGNGLSAPRTVDVDGNGTADIVYAGDLMGNLWKFDISSPDHTQWKVANGTSSTPAPMFTAVGPTGQAQPITTAPVVVPNPSKAGFMVAFGTGKNLTGSDITDTNLNTVYALYDNQPMSIGTATLPDINTTVSQVVLGNGALDASNNTAPPSWPRPGCLAGTGSNRYDISSGGCLYRQSGGLFSAGSTQKTDQGMTVNSTQSSTINNEQIDDQTAYGWYYDIPDIANGNAGKVLANPMLLTGNTLVFYSQNVLMDQVQQGQSNDTESCSSSTETGTPITTVNFFDLFTGNATSNVITFGNLVFNDTNQSDSLDQNRFRIDGVTNYIPNGSSLTAVGANVNIGVSSPARPGKHVGWRIDDR
jgi:Tfp pilus tip-associated adhesin PilY1